LEFARNKPRILKDPVQTKVQKFCNMAGNARQFAGSDGMSDGARQGNHEQVKVVFQRPCGFKAHDALAIDYELSQRMI
jgi:hypothetical protein